MLLLLLCWFRECSKKAAEQAAAIVCLQSLGIHDGRSKAETTWDQGKLSPDRSSWKKNTREPIRKGNFTLPSITLRWQISLDWKFLQPISVVFPNCLGNTGNRNNITAARLTKVSGQTEWDICGLWWEWYFAIRPSFPLQKHIDYWG